MNKTGTITIGIPALNEEFNIQRLLKDILKLNTQNLILDEVIVVSDGSTDKTVKVVEEISKKNQDWNIGVIAEDTRLGKATRINQLSKDVDSDILVILDADITIDDPDFLIKLVAPFSNENVGLTSCRIISVPASTFVEKALEVSMTLKNTLFDTWNGGDNVLHCHGPARAFSKKLYKALEFDQNDGEDMYSYLECIRLGMKFKFVSNTQINYKLPSTLKDHLKQSIRFQEAENTYSESFSDDFMHKHMKIPLGVYIKAFLLSLPTIVKNIPYVLGYLFIFLYSKICVLLGVSFKEMWKVGSSKNLGKSIEQKNRLSVKILVRRAIYIILGTIDRVLGRQNSFIVLCYHSVSKDGWRFNVTFEDFKAQINYMMSVREHIDLNNLANDFESVVQDNSSKFMVTFDDGYENNRVVIEFLSSIGLKPVLFVPSNRESVQRNSLKTNKKLLTDSDLVDMQESGWYIQSHSSTHADLTSLNDNELSYEISSSKLELEGILKNNVISISYPHGRYDSKVLGMVEKSGYKLGFSMDDGILTSKTNKYAIPRVGVDASHSLMEFRYLGSPSVIRFKRFLTKTLRISFS